MGQGIENTKSPLSFRVAKAAMQYAGFGFNGSKKLHKESKK